MHRALQAIAESCVAGLSREAGGSNRWPERGYLLLGSGAVLRLQPLEVPLGPSRGAAQFAPDREDLLLPADKTPAPQDPALWLKMTDYSWCLFVDETSAMPEPYG